MVAGEFDFRGVPMNPLFCLAPFNMFANSAVFAHGNLGVFDFSHLQLSPLPIFLPPALSASSGKLLCSCQHLHLLDDNLNITSLKLAAIKSSSTVDSILYP